MIRRAFFMFAVALLWMVPAFADEAKPLLPGQALVTVPDGTDVTVQLETPVSSADDNVNDGFDVHVVGPVNVGGYTIIAKDAKGRGHISKIDRAGGHGRAGTVAVVIDYVYSVDGLKVRLKNTPYSETGEADRNDASVVGFFTFGIGSNAVRGGDATLDTTRRLIVHVSGTVHVRSSQPADGPSEDADFAK